MGPETPLLQVKRDDGPGNPLKPRVYVNSIFEIRENHTLPRDKVSLGMLLLSSLLPFVVCCCSCCGCCIFCCTAVVHSSHDVALDVVTVTAIIIVPVYVITTLLL